MSPGAMRLFLYRALGFPFSGQAFDSRLAGAFAVSSLYPEAMHAEGHAYQTQRTYSYSHGDFIDPSGDALQQLPPRWRPQPPKIPFTTDPVVVEKEKAKYTEMIMKHLDMMEAESLDEIRGMELQSDRQKSNIASQIKEQLKYKDEQLMEEFHRGTEKLNREKEEQKAELHKKAQQLKEAKFAAFEPKMEQRYNLLESTYKKQRLLVTEVRRVHETRFDDTVNLLDEYAKNLDQSKEDFNKKAKELLDKAKDKVRRQIADRSPHLFG